MTLDPATLSGKRLWLRAKDNGAGGSSVTTWVDQSGGGNDALARSTPPTVVASATPSGGKAVAYAPAGGFHVLPLTASPTIARVTGVRASTVYDTTNYLPDNAFDAATAIVAGNTWASSTLPATLTVHLATPETVTSYRIMPSVQYPIAWTLEGSTNGTSWTTIDTRSGQTLTSGEWSPSYTCSNSTAYGWYRLVVTAANGSIVNLAEVELNGVTNAVTTAGPGEIWAVIKSTAVGGTNNPGPWDVGATGAGGNWWPFSNGAIYENAGLATRTSYTPTMSVASWRIYRISSDGSTSWTASLDNATQKTLSGSAASSLWATTTRPFILGANPEANSAPGSYQVAEMLVFDRQLTSDEAAWMIDYLNTEHGLTVSGGYPPASTSVAAAAATPDAVARAIPTAAAAVLAGATALTLAAAAAVVSAAASTTPLAVASVSAAPAISASPVAAASAAVTPDALASLVGAAPVAAAQVTPAVLAAPIAVAAPTVVPDAHAAPYTPPANPTAAATVIPDAYAAAIGQAAATVTPGAAVSLAAVEVQPWTADESRAGTLAFELGTAAVVAARDVATTPSGIVDHELRVEAHWMPALTPDSAGRVHSAGDYPVITGWLGTPHLWIAGVDVTYFRGVPTVIGRWGDALPGGDTTLSIELPQITPWDTPGVGDLAWLHAGASVELDIVESGGTRHREFTGFLVSDNSGVGEGRLVSTWHAQGVLLAADLVGHKVPTYLDPTDVGTLVADALGRVVSRRYADIVPVTTGILSRQRGAYGDTEWQYVRGLLATAWTTAGRQWTIAPTTTPGRFVLVLKDDPTGAPDWTVTAGAPGVDVDLTADSAETTNVIYGRGVGPDGYAWAGWCYPNLSPDDAPLFCFTDPGRVIRRGYADTDAETDSGTGVSDWQRRMATLGYAVTVTGVFAAADESACRAIQTARGLLIDGRVGPQTWAATFDVGSHGGDLKGAYRRPLAIDPRVDPWLYAANGATVGANPTYDPTVIRRERDIDYGAGITKGEATVSAARDLARSLDPGWSGTITLTTDPREGSRWLIRSGDVVRLLGFRGADHGLLVAETDKDLRSHMVRLTVDSKARDALTLAQILERDSSSRADPARRPGALSRRSRQEQDMAVEFDSEAGGGVIPRFAVYGGLWSVIRIPVSQVGRLAKVDMTAGAKFALAVFGTEITPADLTRMVGNPLSSTSPFDAHADELADAGLIEAWGQSGDACGYWPGKEGASPFTGRMLDTGGVEYVSARPPWVWVAIYAASSTYIEGRLWPAPVT